MNKGEITELSNAYHNGIYDYIDEHGFDDFLKLEMETKIKWLQLVAIRNEITLDIDIE